MSSVNRIEKKQPVPKQKQKQIRSYDRHSVLAFLDKYQLHFSFTTLLTLGLCHHIPSTRNFAKQFFVLQGAKLDPNAPTQIIYDIHPDDKFFVLFAIIAFIFSRAFFMNLVAKPFSHKVLSMKSKSARQRFAEQSWAMVSYSFFFLWGFQILSESSYFHDFDNLYRGFPHYMSYSMKSYYLVEFANWTSQLFIIHIEKRRKDHHQMFAHHIITLFLIYGSYTHRLVRVGNVIQTLMDFVDIWLSLAKVMRYCGFYKVCDFLFLIFFFSWIALRHGLYNYLIYFTHTKLFNLIGDAACPASGSFVEGCVSHFLINTFLALLIGLQLITIIWLFLIIKVLYKILAGSNAEDIRSDSEDEEQETEEESLPEIGPKDEAYAEGENNKPSTNSIRK